MKATWNFGWKRQLRVDWSQVLYRNEKLMWWIDVQLYCPIVNWDAYSTESFTTSFSRLCKAYISAPGRLTMFSRSNIPAHGIPVDWLAIWSMTVTSFTKINFFNNFLFTFSWQEEVFFFLTQKRTFWRAFNRGERVQDSIPTRRWCETVKAKKKNKINWTFRREKDQFHLTIFYIQWKVSSLAPKISCIISWVNYKQSLMIRNNNIFFLNNYKIF